MPLPTSLHLQWATCTVNKKKHILLENMPFRLTRSPPKTPPSLISCHEFYFNIPNFRFLSLLGIYRLGDCPLRGLIHCIVLYEYMVKLLARIKQEASKAICTFKVRWIHTLKSKAICTFKIFDLKDIKPNEFVNYGLACLEQLARFVDQFPYPLMLMLESETIVIVVKILVKKKKKMMMVMVMVMVMDKRMQMMMAMSTRMMCDCHANNV